MIAQFFRGTLSCFMLSVAAVAACVPFVSADTKPVSTKETLKRLPAAAAQLFGGEAADG